MPILDDFERALKTAPSEGSDAGFRKGVELIYQRLGRYAEEDWARADRNRRLERAFDPNLHQAVARVETDEAEDNTVLDEFQRGYNFKGKLLRPAMVRVAVKPAS